MGTSVRAKERRWKERDKRMAGKMEVRQGKETRTEEIKWGRGGEKKGKEEGKKGGGKRKKENERESEGK